MIIILNICVSKELKAEIEWYEDEWLSKNVAYDVNNKRDHELISEIEINFFVLRLDSKSGVRDS